MAEGNVAMRTILLILACVGLVFAQSAYNVKTYTYSIPAFSNDSLKVTNWFPAGDAEGVDVVIKSAEKANAVFEVGYQRGYWDGGAVVPKRPYAVIDTFDVSTAGNFQVLGSSISNAANDTDKVKAIDTLSMGGYAIMARHFNAYRSPYARIVVKGLTGNKATAYALFVIVSQPKYFRVNANDPN